MKRVCVYCGSSLGARPDYAAAARELGAALVARGVHLVYGGGNVGLMGVIADAVLAAGGEVDGVIPRHLMAKELGHQGVTRLHVVESMHERKATMADLSDAFIAMPGGLGTLEELAEIATWTQLGLQEKPLGLLDVAGYYRPLVAFFDHAVAERFLREEHRRLVVVESSPARLLDALAAWKPITTERWIDERTR